MSFHVGRRVPVSGWLVATLVGGMSLAGCGRQSGPDIVPVTGKVTLNGLIVQGARLEFMSQDTAPGKDGVGASPSYGVTNQAGHYTMYFNQKKMGVVPGRCLVRFRSDDRIRVGEESFENQEIFPRKFNDQTDIERTVEPGKSNVIDFELEFSLK